MATLKELYTTLKSLRDMNLPVDEKLLKAADKLEEKIIKEEILPSLSQNIEPLLSEIQRDLVLVVEYHPGTHISVALSRKTNITELLDAKKLELDPEVSHKEIGPRRKKVEKIAPRTGLCIHLKDGSFILEKDAATTFTTAIVRAGLLPVRDLGLKFCGVNIVSTTIDSKYGKAQREAAPGLYVLTHSSTKDKKKILDKISTALKLGWNVEIIK